MNIKPLAIGLIAAGLVIGGSATAHAVTDSPYVTVAWSYAGYPDKTAPQPFIGSVGGADLSAFDELAASPEWCGQPIQVDVYQRTAKDGTSWETLKETGSLLYAHDGGFLGYGALPTPYRVIYPQEFPCTTPEPMPTETPSSGSPTPSASSSPTPSASSSPTAPVIASPSASPSPTVSPTPSSSPSASVAPVPAPSSSTSASPTATGTPSAAASVTSSTPSARELAFTGTNPWPGILAASVLIAAGLVLLARRHYRRG